MRKRAARQQEIEPKETKEAKEAKEVKTTKESKESKEDKESKEEPDNKNDTTDADNKKKKPGRPPKNPKRGPVKRDGIKPGPLSDKNLIMEMIYELPLELKRVFGLLKQYSVRELDINFTRAGVSIIAQDFHKKAYIHITIDGNKLNRYYCSDTLRVGVDAREMETIMGFIDKSYSTIMLKSTDSKAKKILTVVLSENDMDSIEILNTDVIQPQNIQEVITTVNKLSDAAYPIKFQVPSRFLKKIISDYSPHMDLIEFNKFVDEPLHIVCKTRKTTGKKILSDSKCRLVSKLASDDIFATKTKYEYLKPFSNSLIAESVMVSLTNDSTQRILFQSDIDDGCINVKVWLPIVSAATSFTPTVK